MSRVTREQALSDALRAMLDEDDGGRAAVQARAALALPREDAPARKTVAKQVGWLYTAPNSGTTDLSEEICRGYEDNGWTRRPVYVLSPEPEITVEIAENAA